MQENNQKILGAYYYPWYGKLPNPVLGAGHWKSGYTNRPILGEYNSQDEKVIKRHLIWAKEGGIDFFAVEWIGAGTREDITLKDYFLPAVEDSEIKFCINYDSYLTLHRFWTEFSYDFNHKYSSFKTKGQKFVEDFNYFAETYFNHPQYFKIDGRPVVILYNAFVFKNFEPYLETVKKELGRKEFQPFLMADVMCWMGLRTFFSKKQFFTFLSNPMERIKGFYQFFRRLSPGSLGEKTSLDKYFDAITGYNLFEPDKVPRFLERIEKVYQGFSSYAESKNLPFVPVVMPGYDDRNLRDPNCPILKREGGKFYKKYWQIAKKYLDPHLKMVLITTFNEWHEGTEIEPSKEYGDYYLQLTRSFISSHS